jgi:hypothetical protein
LLLTQNIANANGTTTKLLNPQFNINKDTFININDELKPRLIEEFNTLSVVKHGEKCNFGKPCPIWIESHYSLNSTLDIIGKVPFHTSILIQQGKNDSQTSIQQSLLLQQKLTELKHPDHTFITYPNLGHDFTPSSQWLNSFGPMEQPVLEDLFGWLSRHIQKP